MKIKLVNYIADFLVEKGVTHNFSVTGGGAMHLNDALGHKEGLTTIYNHNEQGSAVAAEAYARLSGRIASVCVTSGPGGTNAITGVIGGWLDSIPMFILSGQVKRETTIWSVPELKLRQLGDQEFDITHSVANMTKYCAMVTDENEIAYHLEKAWALANSGRKGPVWLDIPLDVQGAQIETENLKHFDPAAESCGAKPTEAFCRCAAGAGAAADTEDAGTLCRTELTKTAGEILEKIRNAKAPLLLAGTGIRLADAEDELLALLEKLGIPVVTAWNANDTVAFDHPCFAGMPGTVGTRPGNFAVQNCDLLLSLGCRLNIRMIGYNRGDFAKNAYKIIVDIDPEELKKPTVVPDLPVCADVKALLAEMLDGAYEKNPEHDSWRSWCRGNLEKYPAVLPEYHHAEGLINPYVFLDQLFDALDPDDVITTGNGSACVMTFQAAKIKQGQRIFTNSGCASMGYGLPASLGAAVCRMEEGKRVICLDGDGSLMMNVQELATIAHNRLNVKLFLIDNDGYHSIRQTQTNLFNAQFVGIDSRSGVGFPDFGKLADAFGWKYYETDSEDGAPAVIREVLAEEGPVMCRVIVDPEQLFAPKSSSRVLPDGRIVSPTLDDMAPFLDRKEYEASGYRKEK